jgi:zinc protease
MVALRLLVRAGSWDDPPQLEGLANLTAQLLPEGTRQRQAREIHETVDAMGGVLFVDCARDYTVLGLHVLSRHAQQGMALLVELLREPSFPPEELEKKRDRIKGEIASQEDRPGGKAQRLFGEAVFGGRPGYGHETRGFPEALDRMDREVVAAHYSGVLAGRQAIVVAVGDLDASDCARRLSDLLSGWRAGPDPSTPAAPGAGSGGSRRRIVHHPAPQATVIMGQRSVPRDHPDVYGLQVMNYILGGGGFDSRLMEEIRSKRGLAYSVHSQLEPWLHGGLYRVAFQTKNASVREATRIALDVAAGMRHSLVSEAELEGAKRCLVGSFPMRLDSNSGIAASLAMWECYGLGVDYPEQFAQAVARVDRREVMRVAREHLRPEAWTQVAVGDAREMAWDTEDEGDGSG